MTLFDEEEVRRKNAREKKLRKKIIIGIVMSLILIITLMVVIFYLIDNPNKITISLDNGKKYNSTQLQNYFKVTNEEGETKIYSPIRDIAAIFGYTSGTGEYTTNLQDQDSCYVENENEIAIFKLNSNTIYKIDKNTNKGKTSSNYEYEVIKIATPIKKDDKNRLMVESEGLEAGFNISMDYNKKKKKIIIETLPFLVNNAENAVKNKVYNKNEEYELDNAFSNQKALLDNRIVVKSKSSGLKGVFDKTTRQEKCSTQYADITYIPQKERFIVKNQYDKVGILSKEGETKVRIEYEELTLIDSENELYLAGKLNSSQNRVLYGVVDINDSVEMQPKINFDYEAIGVSIEQFQANGLKTGKVLLGSLIPVKQNNLWGLYKIETRNDANGQKIVYCEQVKEPQYHGIGCVTQQTSSNANSIMTIEDYKVLIFRKNKLYGLINSEGNEVARDVFSDMYMETQAGEKNYYAIRNDGKKYNILEELEKNGYKKQTN